MNMKTYKELVLEKYASHYPKLKEIIFTKEEITIKTKEIAELLNKQYRGKELVIITVMAGGLSYTHEIMKRIKSDLYFDYISSSSYEMGERVSEPRINYEGKVSIEGRDVLLVDEIIDSGNTMKKIVDLLKTFNPKSIQTASIIAKPGRVRSGANEYYCFEYDTDEFLVGYGLDYNQKYRNLPFIASVEKE